MNAKNLRSALKKQPFRPFNIHTSSGEVYTVAHPEVAWVQPEGEVAIVSVKTEDGPMVVMIDVDSIIEVDYNKLVKK